MRIERQKRLPFFLWAACCGQRRASLPDPLGSDVEIRVSTIVARILDRPLDSLRPESVLEELGADDLDVAEMIYFSEAALNLPEDTVWRQVTVRPSRLTVGEVLELFTAISFQ